MDRKLRHSLQCHWVDIRPALTIAGAALANYPHLSRITPGEGGQPTLVFPVKTTVGSTDPHGGIGNICCWSALGTAVDTIYAPLNCQPPKGFARRGVVPRGRSAEGRKREAIEPECHADW